MTSPFDPTTPNAQPLWGTDPWQHDAIRTENIGVVLRSLVEHLQTYDRALLKMRRKGGTVADLRGLTRLLEREIVLVMPYTGEERTSLVSPNRLRHQLARLGLGLRLDIRTEESGFPSHTIYRTTTDYFGTFALVLEDYFRGAGFEERTEVWDPMTSTTRYGEVQRLLRLSPFRKAAAGISDAIAHETKTTPSGGVFGLFGTPLSLAPSTDQLLYDAGRHFFDAAWHDDQRLAAATCHLLEMPRFRHALELLYLCLGGDLTRLRSLTGTPRGDALLLFFKEAYPQPAFVALLRRLPDCNGASLAAVRRSAEAVYRRLSRRFARLMMHPSAVTGFPGAPPLYKVVLANYRRLDALRPLRSPAIIAEARAADAEAWELAEELLSTIEPTR